MLPYLSVFSVWPTSTHSWGFVLSVNYKCEIDWYSSFNKLEVSFLLESLTEFNASMISKQWFEGSLINGSIRIGNGTLSKKLSHSNWDCGKGVCFSSVFGFKCRPSLRWRERTDTAQCSHLLVKSSLSWIFFFWNVATTHRTDCRPVESRDSNHYTDVVRWPVLIDSYIFIDAYLVNKKR